MKKYIRITALLLSVTLLFTLIPPVSAEASRPTGFRTSRLRSLRNNNMKAVLKIDDMVFNGVIRIAGLSDEKLDELIQQTLSEMGMSEADFNELYFKSLDTLTQQDLNNIRDAVITAGGLVAHPVAGEAAYVIKVMDQFSQGDRWGLAKTALERGLSSNPMTGSFILAKDILSLLKLAHDEYTGDRATAARKINDFYNNLDRKVAKEIVSQNVGWRVEFIGATAKKTFTFYREQFSEIWTLDMVLTKSTPSYVGIYEGDYTINIEYDLSRMVYELQQSYIDTFSSTPGIREVRVDIISHGTTNAKRTLSGRATASVGVGSWDIVTITPSNTNDNKDVSVSGIAMHLYDAGDDQYEHRDLEYSADESTVTLNHRNYTLTNEGGTFPLPDYADPRPWEEFCDIYQRGDRAKENTPKWELSMGGRS